MPRHDETVFSRHPRMTTLGGILTVWLFTDIIGPSIGQNLAINFDSSLESIAAGRTAGKVFGFLGSAAAVMAIGSKRVD